MIKERPSWVNSSLYPFKSRWITIDHQSLHYVDEGSGPVVLFVHGTPEWSFGFRDLIKGLHSSFRCIAMDHLGFGLSERPAGGDYAVRDHAERLKKFIEKLQLKDISIVANDFGGSIAMSYVLDHASNIRKIVLFNTWMWSLQTDKHYAGPAKVINSWLGRFLYLKMNFPVNTIMPSAYGNRRRLTKEAHLHYKKALPSAKERIAAYAFAKELMDASPWWQSLWERIHLVRDKPVLLFWGMKDKFIPSYELEKWKAGFPNAKVVTFADAGHFVQEEKPVEMIAELNLFLK